MADSPSSQVQQNPFAKFFGEPMAQTESAFAEWARLEEKSFEGAMSGLDESTRLAKETFAYGAALAAQWRKLSLDAIKRAGDAVSKTG